jgi:hypothetical protein
MLIWLYILYFAIIFLCVNLYTSVKGEIYDILFYCILYPTASVADPCHFSVDPDPDLDPRLHASD